MLTAMLSLHLLKQEDKARKEEERQRKLAGDDAAKKKLLSSMTASFGSYLTKAGYLKKHLTAILSSSVVLYNTVSLLTGGERPRWKEADGT